MTTNRPSKRAAGASPIRLASPAATYVDETYNPLQAGNVVRSARICRSQCQNIHHDCGRVKAIGDTAGTV